MNILKINKKNITSAEFDEKTSKWAYKDIKKLNFPITRYFSQPVELSADLTVEDLMKHINNYHEDIDFCFYSYTNGVPFKEYYDLMKIKTDKESFVDIIELHWASSITNGEYCMFGVLSGVVMEEEKMHHVEEYGINSFKMDLVPINQWKHCSIILDETIKASTSNENGQPHTIQLKNRWTLFELLQYFLFELTIYGSVEDQKNEIDSFEIAQKKYDNFRVDPDFAKKLNKDELNVFIVEVKRQIEYNKHSLKEAVDNDDFETASKLKNEETELIEELTKMIKRKKEIG